MRLYRCVEATSCDDYSRVTALRQCAGHSKKAARGAISPGLRRRNFLDIPFCARAPLKVHQFQTGKSGIPVPCPTTEMSLWRVGCVLLLQADRCRPRLASPRPATTPSPMPSWRATLEITARSPGSCARSSRTMRTDRPFSSGGYRFDVAFFSMTPSSLPRYGASGDPRPVHPAHLHRSPPSAGPSRSRSTSSSELAGIDFAARFARTRRRPRRPRPVETSGVNTPTDTRSEAAGPRPASSNRGRARAPKLHECGLTERYCD